MAEFKRVGVGWLTKDRKGINIVMNESVSSGAKLLVKRNQYKTESEEDRKKPDYTITEITE